MIYTTQFMSLEYNQISVSVFCSITNRNTKREQEYPPSYRKELTLHAIFKIVSTGMGLPLTITQLTCQ